jgi:uncharacterized membrane protein HdeD (DUF308 family)
MTEPARTVRHLCFAVGIAFLIFGVALAVAYYQYRHTWSPEVIASAARLLNDPSVPAETLRKVAVQGQKTLVASFEAIDAAILILLITDAVAAVAFLYIFIALGRRQQDGAP